MASFDETGGWKASASAWIASQGEQGDTSRRIIIDPLLDRLLSDVAGKKILDVGCGEGRYARKLALRGADVTGVDPVDDFIVRAQSLHPAGRYVVAFGESLPLPDAAFDFVLSYLSIIDMPDSQKASEEMCRVLKPGGQIYIATISNIASTSDGWHKDADGKKLFRTVDRYMENFSLDLDWAGIRVRNYHRPLSALLKPFFEKGLVVDGFYEPLPDKGSDWYSEEFRAPTFQAIRLRSIQ